MKYRIVDTYDRANNIKSIVVESKGLLDTIFSVGWLCEKYFVYDTEYLHKSKDDAISEAKAWIEDEKNGNHGTIKTVLEVL